MKLSKRFLMMGILSVAGMLVVAQADERIILPKVGSSCPSGFRTEGPYCIQYVKLPETHDTRNDYIEKIGQSCPSGYRSDGSGYCIRYAK